MHIVEAIRHAESEGVVYFLLKSYVEALRYDDIRKVLPEPCGGREYTAVEQVARCFEAITSRLRQGAEYAAAAVAHEIASVFDAALTRLRHLEGADMTPLASSSPFQSSASHG